MNNNITSLAWKMANGSEDAFFEIYDQTIYQLLNFCMTLVPNREDAEDVCQDVFTNLWEGREKFGQIEDIKAFLFTSVKNKCLDHLRSNNRRSKRHDELIKIIENVTQPAQVKDLKSEYKYRLMAEIDNLPERCKQIFKLACFEELSNNEIAIRLGLTSRTVINQKGKAVRLLKLAVITKNLIIYILLHIFLPHSR